MFELAIERIASHLAGLLSELELEVFEFTVQRHGRTIALVMLVDHQDGGVTIADCTLVNKAITRLIDEENLLEGDYTVEVSSPGLDRPLKTAQDFRRILGAPVKFHLKEKLENKLEHDGIVKDVTGESVVVDIKSSTLYIPFVAIQKAVQII
jgi:ribosome maturation factor RimP